MSDVGDAPEKTNNHSSRSSVRSSDLKGQNVNTKYFLFLVKMFQSPISEFSLLRSIIYSNFDFSFGGGIFFHCCTMGSEKTNKHRHVRSSFVFLYTFLMGRFEVWIRVSYSPVLGAEE